MIKDLEVRQCRVLVAVHDSGGIGAAARALGLAQSTVSETLLSLERLLGIPVLQRRAGREATLTVAAEALLPHAHRLISVSEAARVATAGQSLATIGLGTVESISSFLLPQPLSDFRLQWPAVDVRIVIGLCEDLRKRVGRSELDVALTIEGSARPHCRDNVTESWPAQLRMIVSPDHTLARRVLKRRDMEACAFLLADSEGAFNDLLKSWGGNAEGLLRFESGGSIDGVKRGVLTRDVIGILPDYAISEELSTRSLIALKTDVPLPEISLRLTTLKAPPAASPLASLIEKIRELLYKLK